ncbi:MAG: hypothetical protein RR632_05545, partial [Christensenella sp.]
MALRGTTFQNQLVKEKDDGGVYDAIFSDGVVWGCGPSFSGRTVTIAPGMVCIGGRMIAVDGATTFDPGAAVISTGYARLSVRIDVSQTATETECKQVGTFWDMSATTTFLPYTQEDVNYNGTIYEQEICVVQLSGGNITAITRHIGNA